MSIVYDDNGYELFQCQDCGNWTRDIESCALCQHDSCQDCKLQQVEGEDEWFCCLDCRDSWYQLLIREIAIKKGYGEIIDHLDAWERK